MTGAVVIDAVRTASGRGKPGGGLAHLHPADLLAATLRALVDRTGIDPGRVDDVIVGCVSQAGRQTVNIARNALLGAGFPESVPGTTVDRQCGSSQQAAAFAAQGVVAGAYDMVIAAGVESMSANPIGFAALGEDYAGELVAARYPGGFVGQGISAELVAARWGLAREQLDEFSAGSHRKAATATDAGAFDREIVAIPGLDGTPLTRDETIRPLTTVERLAELPAAFADAAMRQRFPEIHDWTITAGNSSPLTDGASAALIMSEEGASAAGLAPRARFHRFAVVGSDPIEMLTGIIPVTRKILERAGLGIEDIDVYEVNEAFAPVPLAWLRDIGADPDRLNVLGGAIALGHPLGSSGTKLLATLLTALERTGGRWGLQVMCEANGMANATVVERLA